MSEMVTPQGKKPILFLIVGVVGGVVLTVLALLGYMFSQSGVSSNMYRNSSYTSSSMELAAPSNVKTSYDTAGNGIQANMTETRSVTKNYLSTHVKDTKAFSTKIESTVAGVNGRVMTNNISVSTDGRNSSGTLVILVPNEHVDSVLKAIESESIKVVTRQITSYEITQEYTDLGRRLTQLEETHTKLRALYNRAATVEEILKVQNELNNILVQIDSVKGRVNALDQLSRNSQITIYHSTDEFSLPYIPEGTFEFGKTFKLAVRGLVSTIDVLLSGFIWVLVFSPLVLIPGLIFYFGFKMFKPKK